MLTSHSYKKDRKKATLCYDVSDQEDIPEDAEKYLKVTLNWRDVFWRNDEMYDKLYDANNLKWIFYGHYYARIFFKSDTMFPDVRIVNAPGDDGKWNEWHVCGIKNKKQGLEAVWFLNRYLYQYREYNLLQLTRTKYSVYILKLVKEFLI